MCRPRTVKGPAPARVRMLPATAPLILTAEISAEAGDSREWMPSGMLPDLRPRRGGEGQRRRRRRRDYGSIATGSDRLGRGQATPPPPGDAPPPVTHHAPGAIWSEVRPDGWTAGLPRVGGTTRRESQNTTNGDTPRAKPGRQRANDALLPLHFPLFSVLTSNSKWIASP